MSTKLMFVLALVMGASACVTEGDDAPLPTEELDESNPPLPPSEQEKDTCGDAQLKGDGACLPN